MKVLNVKNQHHRYVDISVKLTDKELKILNSGSYKLHLFQDSKQGMSEEGIAIAKKITEYFDMTIDDLRKRNGVRKYVEMRMFVSAMLRRHTLMPFMEIGKVMDRDHASIIHHMKRYEAEMRYADVKQKKDDIEALLLESNLIKL